VTAVLIPATWMEPFGRVAVEVGRTGAPMLISPLGGLPEAAAVSGARYLFADFRDPEAAAAALDDLLRGSAETVGTGTTVRPLEQAVLAATRRALSGTAAGTTVGGLP
jgi:glycosyltransferase involved in cell wall biosynthesis